VVLFLLLGVADGNTFVFRGFGMRVRIPFCYEAASDRAAIYRFGWYSLTHVGFGIPFMVELHG
jgi:hypothetical protein